MKITAFNRQEGTIGDSLVIRPPPEGLRKKFSRFKRSFPQSNRSDLEYTCLHFMYKKKETTIDGMRDSTDIKITTFFSIHYSF